MGVRSWDLRGDRDPPLEKSCPYVAGQGYIPYGKEMLKGLPSVGAPGVSLPGNFNFDSQRRRAAACVCDLLNDVERGRCRWEGRGCGREEVEVSLIGVKVVDSESLGVVDLAVMVKEVVYTAGGDCGNAARGPGLHRVVLAPHGVVALAYEDVVTNVVHVAGAAGCVECCNSFLEALAVRCDQRRVDVTETVEGCGVHDRDGCAQVGVPFFVRGEEDILCRAREELGEVDAPSEVEGRGGDARVLARGSVCSKRSSVKVMGPAAGVWGGAGDAAH